MVVVRAERRLRAVTLGWYPSCSIAPSIRTRVSSDIWRSRLLTRFETVCAETPACSATSRIVGRLPEALFTGATLLDRQSDGVFGDPKKEERTCGCKAR